MRLAAKLTTMREAPRQPVEVRATLRDPGLAPYDVVVLDVSTSGFSAELPAGLVIDPGTRVQIATTAFGVLDAVAVREGDGAHGFAFLRPIAPDTLQRLEGQQPSSITPFPPSALAVPAAGPMDHDLSVMDDRPRVSARVSLLLMTGISIGLWLVLAAIAFGASLLR